MKYAPLVRYCVEMLVDDPEAVDVEESVEDRSVQILVRVSQEDTGKVIGRRGQLVGALRNIINSVAAKNDDQVYLKVVTD
ncbi:MAG TPA: KH domain-containing protein [Fimbriimonadales bacterium]|jgi:predicted RNA-binding protein YlqC (UPF0109 family)|nr:KH domain-containing protein [Fimbriimonadales bacterium]